jgi:hypothetical protein
MALLKQDMILLLKPQQYNKDSKLLISLQINIRINISTNNLITTVSHARLHQEPANKLSIRQKRQEIILSA